MGNKLQAIYEGGVLWPLIPLDLPENSLVEIDMHVTETTENLQQKVRKIFLSAGLSTPVALNVEKSTITEDRRRSLADLFAGKNVIGDFLDIDR